MLSRQKTSYLIWNRTVQGNFVLLTKWKRGKLCFYFTSLLIFKFIHFIKCIPILFCLTIHNISPLKISSETYNLPLYIQILCCFPVSCSKTTSFTLEQSELPFPQKHNSVFHTYRPETYPVFFYSQFSYFLFL